MATSARSLADDIRARTDQELTDLVLSRPDLARPAPADLTSLAARSSTKASVHRAVEALDRGHLDVLEALIVVGEPADQARVDSLLGVTDKASKKITAGYVDDLWTRALLWRGSDGFHVVRTVPEVLGAPAGLGAPMRELRPNTPVAPSADAIREAYEEAPTAARAILDRLTWGPAVGVLPTTGPTSTAGRWLLERHLLVPIGSDRVSMPREVALFLREGRLHRGTHLTAPTLSTRSVSMVDRVAGGAANDLLTHVDELIEAWGSAPPRVLRAGGLAVRDLKSVEGIAEVDAQRAAFLVELAYAAGLVADDGAVVPVWAPSAHVDDWADQSAGSRWAELAAAWLSSTRASHLIGTRPAAGATPINALGPDVQWPAVRGIRREVLHELAAVPEGEVASAESVKERILWRRPLRTNAVLAAAIDAVLAEAEWLGVTGRGALGAGGRALLTDADAGIAGTGAKRASRGAAGPGVRRPGAEREGADAARRVERAAEAMTEHLPAPVDHILIQADLTAVAPGPLVGELAGFMRLAADVESRGGATVYRFTNQSLRRALDAGWSASELLQMLRSSSRTELPQPLEYLVTDVARKHGVTRIGGAAAYIRSDDEAVLDAMVANRDLASLQLRRIAPTVLISGADPRVLVESLREHGFAPAREGTDGAVVHAVATRRRAAARRSAKAPRISPVDASVATELIANLRTAEANADARRQAEASSGAPRIPSTDPVVTLALLRDAMAEGHGVWIGLADQAGATKRELIHPTGIDAGRVRALDSSGREKSYSIHRISGATIDA